MTTYAPIPSFRELVQPVFRKTYASMLNGLWSSEDDIEVYLNRSTASILMIAKTIRHLKSTKSVTILVPEYFCEQALAMIRSEPWIEIKFYPLIGSRESDIEYIESLQCEIDAIIHVHYFGQKNEIKMIKKVCRRREVFLIEDCAHVPTIEEGMGITGDFILFSPHKLFPVPSIGVLVFRSKGLMLKKFDWSDVRCFIESHLNKLDSEGFPIAWFMKRFVQRALLSFGWFSQHPSLEEPGYEVRTVCEPYRPNNYALASLGLACSKLSHALQQRRFSYDMISHLLKAECAINLAPPKSVPYCVEVDFSDDTIFDKFGKIYSGACYRWPDLPPEVENTALISDAKRKCYIPCHSTFRPSEILAAFTSSRDLVEMSDDGEWSISEVDELQWSHLYAKLDSTNLVQMPRYSSSRAPRFFKAKFYVIYEGDLQVAIFQSLECSLGLVRIVRVNRGPLWLQSPTPQQVTNCFKVLKKSYSLKRMAVLFISPELPIEAGHRLLMSLLGYYQVSKHSWKSSMIDLGLSIDEIRANLSSRWRNQLVKAEKLPLNTSIRTGDTTLSWLLDRYQDSMNEKDFVGPSVEFIQELYRSSSPEDFLISCVSTDDKIVSAALVVVHGSTATYFIGWSSEEGKPLCGMNLVLWSSIKYLKDIGVKSFDLGGICEESTPGVAKFKNGLRGSEYTLIGDYLSV